MKYFFILLGVSISHVCSAQDFYSLEEIQSIEITFAESNWDALLDAQKNGAEEYILAQSVTINGEVFDSVGVKYKGNSTYNPNQVKNPFHIELDTYKDHNYQGYKDIKLSNVAKDPSFLREVLSYQILRQYMDAPQSNYANVYVNGDLIGLYSNSEAVSKTFIADRFGSKSNTFFKCNPIGGAGPQSNDKPNLVYMGTDSTSYYESYEIKSDDGWQDLITLCNTLANEEDKIEQTIDVDRVIWMHAFNNALVNLDSYAGRFAQNYYLYKDESDRFMPVVWDLNESFGRFSDTGSGNLTNTNAKQQMDLFLHENDSEFPLIQKILSNSRFKKMYLAHIKTMLEENFENGSYFSTGETLKSLIDTDVQNDPNKIFSYANFDSNLTTDVNAGGGGPGGGSTPGITSLMDGRASYLLNLPELSVTDPTISNINTSSDPLINEEAIISAEIVNANYAYLGYRINRRAPFTKVEMLDDGLNGDDVANDGIYTAKFIVSSASTQYYIYAENDEIGKFSPQRAEYEYYIISAGTISGNIGEVVINELLASNDGIISDQDDEFDDWIELYNNSSQAVDLSGFYLSDKNLSPTKWSFPTGTSIGAGEYLIIWADEDDEQAGLHANFKLSSSGEEVILSDGNGQILDEITFDEQLTDISFGRFDNGTGSFQKMFPTPNAINDGTTNTVQINEHKSFSLTPNPVSDVVTIESANDENRLSIYNIQGQLEFEADFNSKTNVMVSNWTPGLYIAKLGVETIKFVVN